ncbi:MAG: hypothetical protein LBR79_02205 [Oscillospiraceae bacterium]|jgi:hypothetical protein|nr:hypothetical protein [Oscillospiraceae bacterium]
MAPTTKYKQIILNYTAAVQNLNKSVELRNCTLEHFLKPLNKAVKEAKGVVGHRKINWKKVLQQYESYVENELVKQCPELEKDLSDYFDVNKVMSKMQSAGKNVSRDTKKNVESLAERLDTIDKVYVYAMKGVRVYGEFSDLKSAVESSQRSLRNGVSSETVSQRVKSATESFCKTCESPLLKFRAVADSKFSGSSKTKERAKIVKSSQTLTLIQAAKKGPNKKNTTAVLNQLKKNHKIMLGAAVDKTLKVLETKKF